MVKDVDEPAMHMRPLPLGVHQGTCCASCLHISDSLLRCGGCLHAWYCSRDCQQAHYKEHKSSCKLIQVWNSLQHGLDERHMPRTPQEFMRQRLVTCEVLQQMTQSDIEPVVGTAIRCEAKCSICMRTREQLGGALSACPECHMGWACEAHASTYLQQQHTQAVCDMYKLMHGIQVWWHKQLRSTGHPPNQHLPDNTRTSFSPLPEAGWDAYARWRPLPEFEPEQLAVTTQYLSLPLTVLLALQHHYTTEELADMKCVVLHVVGAQLEEVVSVFAWEELLHLLPGCTALHLALIGPELTSVAGEAGHGMSEQEQQCVSCPSCTEQGRSFTVSYHSSTYHEFLRHQTRPGSSQPAPSLVAAFNSGIHGDSGSWEASLDALMTAGTPALFTSYTEREADRDALVWTRLGGKVTKPPQMNPYRALEPLLDPSYIDVWFHRNFYWFCARGSCAACQAGVP